MPRIIAEGATEFFKERLIEKNWEGVPYAPYKGKEPSRGSLMMRSPGGLFSTIHPSEESPDKVTISAGGAKVPYARVHNEGQRVRGLAYVRPYTHNNLFGKGKRAQIKAHVRKFDFKMPKRQFIGHSNRLNARLRMRIINELKAKS